MEPEVPGCVTAHLGAMGFASRGMKRRAADQHAEGKKRKAADQQDEGMKRKAADQQAEGMQRKRLPTSKPRA